MIGRARYRQAVAFNGQRLDAVDSPEEQLRDWRARIALFMRIEVSFFRKIQLASD